MQYSSMRFTEQLNRYLEAFPEIDLSKQNTEDHQINVERKTVMRKQFKKYKFDANWPFEIKSHVEFVNVSLTFNPVEFVCALPCFTECDN
jgi:hypothetical protein